VTVAIIDVSKKAYAIKQQDLDNWQDQKKLRAFAQGVAHAMAFNRRYPEMPQHIVDAILHIPEEYTVGRCGLRPITSTYVQDTYMTAKYELIFTLVAVDGSEAHTLIIYMP
jgi:hypothetical protein